MTRHMSVVSQSKRSRTHEDQLIVAFCFAQHFFSPFMLAEEFTSFD